MEKSKVRELADALSRIKLKRPLKIMEVCGTHTTEFFRTGVKDRFPEGLTLVDGPGCPVCVTPNNYLDLGIEIAKKHKVVIATFGDMIKVPSSYSSLRQEIAEGMDVRVTYSPIDAVDIAEKNPEIEVMLLSVGFETTAPTEAVAILDAKKRGLKNFTLLSGNKITVPAVRALLDAKEIELDGFILPGHVSAIIGSEAWRFIPDEFKRPSVVAGFAAHELIIGVISLLKMLNNNEIDLKNEYPYIVKSEGNRRAQEIMMEVFEPSDADWRGIGVIPGSGLAIRTEFEEFDAGKKFPVTPPEPKEARGCRCGELLRGLILPPECPLFGTICHPEKPVGACMVSSEGPCSAYYKYWRK